MPLRLLLTGGGSGGPTAPLIALTQYLRLTLPEPPEVLFLGSESGPERQMVEKAGIAFESIPSGKLRRYWSWENLRDPLRILQGAGISALWLRRFRPEVIVSAGSFVSVPVAWVARPLGVPQVLLQMDVRPGLANRLMAPVATALAHYPEPLQGFSRPALKKRVGPVIRPEILNSNAEAGRSRFQLPDRPVLLITGGGQGALGLNEAVRPWISAWTQTHEVVHLTGAGKPPVSEASGYHAFEFVHEGMGDLLACADVVLTRAGMGMLGELAALGKDAVLVPLPGSHQGDNARWIAEKQAGVLLEQAELQAHGGPWWSSFCQEREPGQLGRRLMEVLPPGGAESLAELVLECAR